MIRCSLSIIPLDRREDIIRDLDLEPQRGGKIEGDLTVFVPKERKRKKEPEFKLTNQVFSLLWENLTPVQRKVAKGVIQGKGCNELATELSNELEFVKVHPDDVELAHRCACDVVRSIATC